MEFTKQNVIKLLTDAQDLINQLSKQNKDKSVEFKNVRGLTEYHKGKNHAFELVSSYLKDIIKWIDEYMLDTNDHINKEHK